MCARVHSQRCSHTPADGDRWNNYTQTERWDAVLGCVVLAVVGLILGQLRFLLLSDSAFESSVIWT